MIYVNTKTGRMKSSAPNVSNIPKNRIMDISEPYFDPDQDPDEWLLGGTHLNAGITTMMYGGTQSGKSMFNTQALARYVRSKGTT